MQLFSEFIFYGAYEYFIIIYLFFFTSICFLLEGIKVKILNGLFHSCLV